MSVPDLGTFATGAGPVIAADGTVYIGNEQGRLHALRAERQSVLAPRPSAGAGDQGIAGRDRGWLDLRDHGRVHRKRDDGSPHQSTHRGGYQAARIDPASLPARRRLSRADAVSGAVRKLRRVQEPRQRRGAGECGEIRRHRGRGRAGHLQGAGRARSAAHRVRGEFERDPGRCPRHARVGYDHRRSESLRRLHLLDGVRLRARRGRRAGRHRHPAPGGGDLHLRGRRSSVGAGLRRQGCRRIHLLAGGKIHRAVPEP